MVDVPSQRTSRHRRWRHRRLQHRLPPGTARRIRCRAARAQATHLRHHVARGRARRSTAGDAQPHPAGAVHHEPVRHARGRDRSGHRLPASWFGERGDQRGAVRGARRGASMARVLRPRGRHHHPCRHQGAGPARPTSTISSVACTCRATASPTRSTPRRRWPRARGPEGLGSSRTLKVDRIVVENGRAVGVEYTVRRRDRCASAPTPW